MKVTVCFFASLRERVGHQAIHREIAEGTTAGDLLGGLHEDFPALAGSGRIAIAVNSEYTDPSHVLREGDEIALIPPVSGGAGEPAPRHNRREGRLP